MKIPDTLKQLTRERLSPSALFLLLLCMTELISLLLLFISPGTVFAEILFVNRADSLMDYFHPLLTFSRAPINDFYHQVSTFYPPLALLFYLIMYRLIPTDALPADDFVARESQITLIPYLLLTVLLSIAIVYILAALRKGTNLERKLFSVSALLAAPMLYQFDRGNIIILSFFFALLFFHWKDSDSPVKRELALIFLAIAAGLKIYPMLFGVLLLLEKRWRDALRCIIYGLLAFWLPALIFGGVNPMDLLRNLADMSVGTQSEGFGYKANFSNTFALLFSAFRIPYAPALPSVLTYVLGLLTLGSAFLQQSNWKRVCAFSVLIVALPGFSYVYVLIFLLIPAVLFLNESDGQPRCTLNYVYAFLLAACFMPLPFTGLIYSSYYPTYPLTVSTFAESLAVLFLSLMLIGEAAVRLWGICSTRLAHRHASPSSDPQV